MVLFLVNQENNNNDDIIVITFCRKHNISQCTLAELTDEDLIRLGVDDADIRSKLLVEAKNLPIYEETKNM